MVSWQAFPSLPPRAPLAFPSHPLSLPSETPATQANTNTVILLEPYCATITQSLGYLCFYLLIFSGKNKTVSIITFNFLRD